MTARRSAVTEQRERQQRRRALLKIVHRRGDRRDLHRYFDAARKLRRPPQIHHLLRAWVGGEKTVASLRSVHVYPAILLQEFVHCGGRCRPVWRAQLAPILVIPQNRR